MVRWRWALGGLAALVASSAAAAPFCVVSSTGENCWYFDYPSCQRAAAQARGACVAQQEEAPRQSYQPRPAAGAPFCVVTSYGTNCWYYDAPSCQRAAQSARGACVVNPDR
jgi:hypothetical protein